MWKTALMFEADSGNLRREREEERERERGRERERERGRELPVIW